jgi:hypothetical protein
MLLPLPLAERYTSPTQDGQYLLNPVNSYRFLTAVATVSPASQLGTSGMALTRAKKVFTDSAFRATEVRLLFFSQPRTYQYITLVGGTLTLAAAPQFVWEVWGTLASGSSAAQVVDVIALLDYSTGDVLSRLPEPPQAHTIP